MKWFRRTSSTQGHGPAAEAENDKLAAGDHHLSALFRAGHEVITALREIESN